MINVTLITNKGDGIPSTIPVADGSTLGQFLDLAFEGNIEDFKIRVRANGVSVEGHDDYVLHDGDRVSMSSRKIDGNKR
jgi:hypothetical protein